jgi:exosortase C (VPDSG-CTERM-specific)
LHTIESDLHLHVPVVPFIVAYLLWEQPRQRTAYKSSPLWALVLCGVAAAAVVIGLSFRASLTVNDYLAVMAFAYVSFLAAGGFLVHGAKWMSTHAFAMGFLLFLVPLPDGAVAWLEAGSANASAEASAWLFKLVGTPLLHKGTLLELPGITLEVARECSGIRSSWVLFFTAVLASRVLASPWRRLFLVALVVPLGILRNGFRILVIGLLCVHFGPHMIDSFIHKRGGGIFFALSLVPLSLTLLWLRRREDHLARSGNEFQSAEGSTRRDEVPI